MTPMMETALGATPRAPLTAPMSTLLTSRGSVARVRGAAPGAAGRDSETPMAAGEALGAGEVDGVALREAPEGRALGVDVRVTLMVEVAERLARAVGEGKLVRVGEGVGERVAEADPGAASTAAATVTGGGLLAACAAMAAALVLVPADICARRVVAARWRSAGESSRFLSPFLRRVAAFFLQNARVWVRIACVRACVCG